MNLPATALTAGTDGALIIASAPRIPGLHFRAFRNEADLAAMVQVHNASMAANGENETWSTASFANEIANLTNIDPRQDYVLAFVDDRLIAASEIEWADDPHGQRHYRSADFVLPRWRRRGIGTAMLQRNEDRLREIAATHDLEKPAVLLSLLAELDASFQRHIGDPGFGIDLCVAAFDGAEIAGGVLGYVDAAENIAHRYLRG